MTDLEAYFSGGGIGIAIVGIFIKNFFSTYKKKDREYAQKEYRGCSSRRENKTQ